MRTETFFFTFILKFITKWLDLNFGSLESEADALPIEPKPQHKSFVLLILCPILQAKDQRKFMLF